MTIQDELKTKYENGELTRLQYVKRMAFTCYIYRYMYKALANGRGIVAVIYTYKCRGNVYYFVAVMTILKMSR